MGIDKWIELIVIGALAGATGQLARAIVGIAKANRDATAAGTGSGAAFNASQLVISLLIGATAGVLAALLMKDNLSGPKIELSTILGLVGAGYAGADFIEGAMGTLKPQAPATQTVITTYPLLPSPQPAPVASQQSAQLVQAAQPAQPIVNPLAVG